MCVCVCVCGGLLCFALLCWGFFSGGGMLVGIFFQFHDSIEP